MKNLKTIFYTALQNTISFHAVHTSAFGFAFEHF